MEVAIRIEDHKFILKLSGEFDTQACRQLDEALEQSSKSFCSHVLIDMQHLHTINTAGQRTILSYLARLQSLEMMMVLYQVNDTVKKAFAESGLDKLVTIVPTLQDAKIITDSHSS